MMGLDEVTMFAIGFVTFNAVLVISYDVVQWLLLEHLKCIGDTNLCRATIAVMIWSLAILTVFYLPSEISYQAFGILKYWIPVLFVLLIWLLREIFKHPWQRRKIE